MTYSNAGGVTLVACVSASSRGRWWSGVVFGGRVVLLCASGVFVAAVGWSWSFVGRCHHPWTAGIMSAGGLLVTLHRGNVVAKWTLVVVGRCVEVVGGVVGVGQGTGVCGCYYINKIK